MDLRLDSHIAHLYKSKSQQIRVMTEDWVVKNIYCPICGTRLLSSFGNNMPVADFYCADCNEQYELKSKSSKSGVMGRKITDGAYATMIERISSLDNPNFMFLTYNEYMVSNLVLVPKYFFIPTIIEQRKPLASTAKRAGWVGCNINLGAIPDSGKIFIIKQGEKIQRNIIEQNYLRTQSLITNNIDSRGWMLDVLACVERVPTRSFCLNDIYNFENELQLKHPSNNFVRDKIRQQLQVLRDKGFVEFTSRGNYKKI
ncbi:MAG: DpnI domain-containing protein [Rikenellaceae bacterium]